jgi:RecB family endonuclease NucS
MDFLYRPKLDISLDFAITKFKESPDKIMLLIVGNCQIKYKGRAQSFLDWGDRLAILKEDGTIIIHQSRNREPVNWQPHGTKTIFQKENNLFTVTAINYKNKERMTIFFRKIDIILTKKMKDKAVLQIVGMEKDIVDKIVENPEIIESGLRITQREKQTSCGMIDLYGYDDRHTPVVIEVKRSQANIAAVHQLRMYIKDLKKGQPDIKIRGLLCAPKIPVMVKKLLDDYHLEHREFEWHHELYDAHQRTIHDFK